MIKKKVKTKEIELEDLNKEIELKQKENEEEIQQQIENEITWKTKLSKAEKKLKYINAVIAEKKKKQTKKRYTGKSPPRKVTNTYAQTIEQSEYN